MPFNGLDELLKVFIFSSGARPDLSRTYFEVGKRLLDPNSKHEKLNGIDANGYLEKALVLFEEIGLEGEMDDLERLMGS